MTRKLIALAAITVALAVPVGSMFDGADSAPAQPDGWTWTG